MIEHWSRMRFLQPSMSDIIDIAVVTFIIYHLFRLVSGTRALQMMMGFVVLMIAAYAAQANLGYNYMRGEFWDIAVRLDATLDELRQAELLGQNLFGTRYALDIHNHLGAGAYICGEESALLESLEGKLGMPRLKGQAGTYGANEGIWVQSIIAAQGPPG